MKDAYRRLGLTLATGLLVAGCANNTTRPTAADEQQIQEQQQRISALEIELATKEKQLAAAQADQPAGTAMSPTVGSDPTGLFPPNAEPGRCYARILRPARYENRTETVVRKEASQRVEVIPAQYETVTETVMVKEASTRIETIPARYETVTETVMIRPESTRLETVPATYKTVNERVMVAPARTEWKRGPASAFSGMGVLETSTTDTGEVMCLVEIPATWDTVSRQVVDQPATTREVVVPAEYKTITKTVIAAPATTHEVEIPAEYENIQVTRLVAPAKETMVDIPAEYENVTRRVQVQEERLEWREVLCEVNLTADNVRRLQNALNRKGYDAGAADGILGSATMRAANNYAKRNGLPYGSNYIAIETAEHLGLQAR
jgi:hypothetical protein